MHRFLKINRKVRFFIVRLFYFAAGLNVATWRNEVERIWALKKLDYLEYIDSEIEKTQPRDGAGNAILSSQDFENSAFLSKKNLNERSARITQSRYMVSRYTSGTSGIRTKVFLTKSEMSRLLAVRDYCFRFYGTRLGDREARLWGTRSKSIGSRIKDWFLHRKSFYVVNDNMENIVEDLISWRPDYIYGYSSSIISISRFLIERNINVKGIKLVICTAEQILPAQKKLIGYAFNSKVVEEYGSTEFDIVAFEDLDGDLRVVNPWLVVESGKESLLITDVLRRTQHFVRYEIGDYGEVRQKSSKGLGGDIVIGALEGRSANRYAYDENNRDFHSVEFPKAMNLYFNKYDDLFDFFITQNERGQFSLYLSSEPKIGSDRFCDWLRKTLKQTADVNVNIRVGRIGCLNDFKGKRSYFIQNIKLAQVGPYFEA